MAPILTLSSSRPVGPLTGADEERSLAFPLASRPQGFVRNSLRTGSLINLDLRALKYVPMGGVRKLDLVIEAFNVFNHPNVLSVNQFFGSGLVAVSTFGQPTSYTAPRQLRFSIDFEF